MECVLPAATASDLYLWPKLGLFTCLRPSLGSRKHSSLYLFLPKSERVSYGC